MDNPIKSSENDMEIWKLNCDDMETSFYIIFIQEVIFV